MVGLQYLFLEPNADDPLNKGESCFYPTLYLYWGRTGTENRIFY